MTAPQGPSSLHSPTSRRGLALALLCSAQFMVVLDASIASVALPSLREDLDMGEGSLQYVLSLYALTFGGFLILAGRAGDQFGLGLGVAFVVSNIAATSGVSGLINTSQQVGFAAGLAALATVAVSRTDASGGPGDPANLVSGYGFGLLVAAGIGALGALCVALVLSRRPVRSAPSGNPVPVNCCWTGTAGQAAHGGRDSRQVA